MLKIDIHTHILPKHIPNFKEMFGYGGFIHLEHHCEGCARMMRDGQFFREVEANCWDAQARLVDCDREDIHKQVLSTVPTMFSYWAKAKDTQKVAQILNDHIAEVVDALPHRFIGLGTLPMQDTDLAIAELRRCAEDLGLAGVQIGSNINQKNLDEAQFFPIFEAAADLGMSVFVHPWEMMGQADMQKYWLPWLVGMPAETSRAICSMIFGGVFERLPHLRVAFAHGGGSFPFTIGRVAHGHKVRPDLCAIDNEKSPYDYLGKFWVDSLVHDPQMLQVLVELFGERRVCLGTDYPFPLGESPAGEVILKAYPDAISTQESLFYKSALEWLDLEA
jgi:aminocarboxymuconate-semialdehyde decarboxylase